MGTEHSKGAIIKALVGNGLVTLFKLIAWVFSGSGAMLSEAIHSFVDTLNQVLLFVGYKRSLAPATARHPFGFGVEANFWGLLAAIGILVLGGGMSIQHGIHGLSHPEMPTNLVLVFVVLAVAFVIELWVLYSVVKDLQKTRGERGWIEHIKAQPPGTLTVLLEDAAAVMGCVLAAIAVGMSAALGSGVPDAVGQLVIGAMLAIVGVYLIWSNRGMIVGASLPAKKNSEIQRFLEDLPGIDRVTSLATRRLGRGKFRVKAEVVFNGGFIAGRCMGEFTQPIAECVTPEDAAPLLGRFADACFLEQAKHVDWLERKIYEAFPGADFIDLEPHLRDF